MQRILFVTLSLFLVALNASADQLSQEAIMNFAEQAKLPLHDRHIKAITSGKKIEKPDYPQTVIKHIRGDKSNRFPTSAEVKSIMTKIVEPLKAQIKAEINKKLTEEGLLTTGTHRQTTLPICRSATKKKTIDSSNTKQYDILWIPEGALVPENYKQAFGEDVILIQSDDDSMRMAKDFNLKCLPTRIRAKGDTIYTHEGVSALLNYSKDFDGDGFISKEMLSALKGE